MKQNKYPRLTKVLTKVYYAMYIGIVVYLFWGLVNIGVDKSVDTDNSIVDSILRVAGIID